MSHNITLPSTELPSNSVDLRDSDSFIEPDVVYRGLSDRGCYLIYLSGTGSLLTIIDNELQAFLDIPSFVDWLRGNEDSAISLLVWEPTSFTWFTEIK